MFVELKQINQLRFSLTQQNWHVRTVFRRDIGNQKCSLASGSRWQAGELKSASRLPHSHTPQDRNYLVGTCCLSVSLVGLVAVFAVGNRSRIHGLRLSVQSISLVFWWFRVLAALLASESLRDRAPLACLRSSLPSQSISPETGCQWWSSSPPQRLETPPQATPCTPPAACTARP